MDDAKMAPDAHQVMQLEALAGQASRAISLAGKSLKLNRKLSVAAGSQRK